MTPSLQRELAAAYEKVGDVQGNSSQLGLGDTASALTNYRKALEIRLRVDSSHTNLQNQLATAADHRWIGVILLNKGDTGSALQNANAAIKITEKLNRNAPADTGVLREMEQDYQAAALAQGGGGPTGSLGEFNESLANNRNALAVAERLLRLSQTTWKKETTSRDTRYGSAMTCTCSVEGTKHWNIIAMPCIFSKPRTAEPMRCSNCERTWSILESQMNCWRMAMQPDRCSSIVRG